MNSLRFLFEGQRIADNQTPKEVQYTLPWVKLQQVKGREQKFPFVFDVKAMHPIKLCGIFAQIIGRS